MPSMKEAKSDTFTNIVTINFNMFASSVKDRVNSHIECINIITE